MRSVLTYLFLVGIPLAGLVGILKVGEGLSAPRAIAGEWVAVERRSGAGWEPGCRTPVDTDEAEQEPTRVRIAQSGARADVSWSSVHAEAFRVALKGDTLEGRLALTADEKCRGGTLTLNAVVRVVNDREHIVGELRPEECSTCGPIPVDWRRRR